MPKCEADQILRDQINRFMISNGLTICGAAAALGVDRTTFWRFCDSGRARSDTRALYRKALEKCNENTATIFAQHAGAAAVQVGRANTVLKRGVAGRELKQIRKTCELVLALLDAYEAQLQGTEP